MSYACLKRQIFSRNGYQLVPIRFEDIFLIKQWRNAQMSILRQEKPLDDEMQKAYFENILLPSFVLSTPSQILFSFLKENRCIGYGGLVHIDWGTLKGEVSFLADTERANDFEVYKADFNAFLILIKEVAFRELHFQSLFTETYDIRPLHLSILENNGFIEEKRLKNHVVIDGYPRDALIHRCYT